MASHRSDPRPPSPPTPLTREAGNDRAASARPAAEAPLGWPIVDRRHHVEDPPGGVERRGGPDGARSRAGDALLAPLAPFRLAAFALGVARAVGHYRWSDWQLLCATVVVGAYAIVTTLRPVPVRDNASVRMRVVIEQALYTFVVLLTGGWASPFAPCLIPTGMLAGFTSGAWFSAQLASASVLVITVQNIPQTGTDTGVRDAALWIGLLGVVAFTSGLSHRSMRDAARQQRLALDRVGKLAEANSLLLSLQRVAQTLPASLDLEEVLDSTVARIRSLVDHDTIAVLLLDPAEQRFQPTRVHGFSSCPAPTDAELPAPLRTVMASPKTLLLDTIADGHGLAPSARSGVYTALRARGAVVGLLAIESGRVEAFGQQQAEIVHGLAEPFGIAIDNARLFGQIRTVGASEERSRIARDLHDHVGSSLALLGFEVDRVAAVASRGEPVDDALHELRGQVTAVVVQVRETLYDLRTDVTEARDLAATLADFLRRVERRSGLDVHLSTSVLDRLPLVHERELWQIAREAVTNVERHASASRLDVELGQSEGTTRLVITDDGTGLNTRAPRADSYGMLGMRERAAGIGADLRIESPDHGGTTIRVELRALESGEAGRQRWD